MSYDNYPTPPPTSSPKHTSQSYHPGFSPKLPAQETYYQDTAPSSSKLPAQDTYYQSTQPAQPYQSSGSKAPAQETYYKQSYSTPASPTHWDPSSHPPPDHPVATTTTNFAYLPPRRSSSPIPSSYKVPNTSQSRPISPSSRPSRTKTRTPPRPIYFSPTNPPPTPYNTSRPAPRPGFLSRIRSFLRSILRWARRHPIYAGLASFLPILAGAGLVKAGKALGLGKILKGGLGLGGLVGALVESMGGGKGDREEGEKGEEGKGRGIGKEKEEETEWGWGMDHFVGFGGTKAGPLDGIMKVLLMGVNHYCKLTPSAVPRAASILLELYFLEVKK